jgi:CelD/BcsL family acetyltransferase involved in cellulose biosynthesis
MEQATRDATERPARAGARTTRWRVGTYASRADIERLLPEWRELFVAAGTANPFAHPDWVLPWAKHFVPSGAAEIVAVHSGDRLVAVAPFYRVARRFFGVLSASRLRLVGDGRDDLVTELVEVLAMPELRRRALRAVIEHLHDEPGWDWIELAVTPDQGWLEPNMVTPERGSHVMNFYTDSAVVVPLPPSRDELPRHLKRNVKESIRRARNRLARDGHDWDVVELTEGKDLEHGLDELVRMHRLRARMDIRVKHPDRLALGVQEQFVREATHAMARGGRASIFLLCVDGAPAAVQLVLRANDSAYLSISGYEPNWWDFGVMTLLTAEVLGAAAERGEGTVNLSLGPDNAKLRWSERTVLYPYFGIVRGRVRSRWAFRAFLHARAHLPPAQPILDKARNLS